MKKNMIFIVIFLALSSKLAFAQTEENVTVDELRKIYSSLEYNTIAFDDLKKKWFINDPVFVREVYNRFVVKNELRINGKHVPFNVIKEKSQDIYEGTIIIDVRKRYYDDEIEYFSFMPVSEIDKSDAKPMFDPVNDGFLLREIIGDNLYQKIQSQGYFFSNITKDDFDTKAGYYFDVNMNLLNPEVMFWSTTSNYRNKYLVSAVGKWGSDEVFLPGWYFGEYMVGVKLTYHSLLSSDQKDYTYSITAGTSMPASKPYAADDMPAMPLFKSGDNAYFKISGKPLKYIFPSLENLYMDLEGSFTFSDYQRSDYGLVQPVEFYSVRDYYSFTIKQRKIFNMFDFGMFEAGLRISTQSTDHYKIDPTSQKVKDLQPWKDYIEKFTHFVTLDLGVTRSGGLFQHSVNLLFSYGTEDYGYMGVNAKFMLNDNFGFDMRMYKGFGLNEKKFPWRGDSYLVFSPVFRINY